MRNYSASLRLSEGEESNLPVALGFSDARPLMLIRQSRAALHIRTFLRLVRRTPIQIHSGGSLLALALTGLGSHPMIYDIPYIN